MRYNRRKSGKFAVMTKIVHLNLKEPYGGETDLYFGSIKAIYESVPKDAVGITYRSLTNALRGKDFYKNKKCVIRVGELRQKTQENRHNKQGEET